MKCPYCGNEMEKGKATFMAVQGFGQMLASFTSDEESAKGFFKRKTQDKMILSGAEEEAYYCPFCKKLMPVFDVESL